MLISRLREERRAGFSETVNYSFLVLLEFQLDMGDVLDGYGKEQIALSEEQYKTCVGAFEAFSRDGYLGPFELNSCLRSLGHGASAQEFNDLLETHDVYTKGGLDLQTFLYIVAQREASVLHKQKLCAAFALFDRDQNG